MYNYKAIKKWREKYDLNQKDIAVAVGLRKPSPVVRYENGKTNIGAIKLGKVIGFFAQRLSIEDMNKFINELFELNIEVLKKQNPNVKYVNLLEENNELLKNKAQHLESEIEDIKKFLQKDGRREIDKFAASLS